MKDGKQWKTCRGGISLESCAVCEKNDKDKFLGFRIKLKERKIVREPGKT